MVHFFQVGRSRAVENETVSSLMQGMVYPAAQDMELWPDHLGAAYLD